METETKPRAILPRLKVFLIKALCLLALAPFAATLINGGIAKCYERYEDIRASIVERFREVQIVREYLPRESLPVTDVIKTAAKRHGIPSLLIKAMIYQESGIGMKTDRIRFEPHLLKRVKREAWMTEAEVQAQASSWGLMQIIPLFHQKRCGLQSFGDLLDVEINVECGTSIIAECLHRRQGVKDKLERFRQCLGEYNGDAEGYPKEVLGRLARLVVDEAL